MGDKVTIELQKRDIYGKKVARLRRQGLTPVVMYGANIEPVAAQVETTKLARVYQEASFHTPVEITYDGKKRLAMIKDVDTDQVRHQLRHVAFHVVKQNQPVEAEVAVRLIGGGESEAEKAGFVVLQAIDRIEVKALPKNLPESVDIDVSGLKEVGDRVTLGDAVLPDGVEFVEREAKATNDEEERPKLTDLMVASVYEPAALQAANESAAGESTEVVNDGTPADDETAEEASKDA